MPEPKLSVTVFALLLTTMVAPAHHAFEAEYDENKLITVTGVVTKFEWTNPHAWMYLDVRDERGKITNWSFEMGAPGGLLNRGWKKGELKRGDAVIIDGYSSRHHARVANARMVTLPDGRKLFGGFQSTPGNPTGAGNPTGK
jgi:hypothetical protein